jgi:phage recombination protein Bet
MTTEPDKQSENEKPTVPKPRALAVMASRLNVEPQKLLQTLTETVFKGATESELLTLVVVANEYGLSPLLKEIYAFPNRQGGIVPVVSIDGWISMVNRQPQLDGLKFSYESDSDGNPIACTCTIYIKDRTHPVEVTEFYKECYRATEPWKQMPRRMLRHKALKEAARVAFGFSGVTDEDEARDISNQGFPPPREIPHTLGQTAGKGPLRTEKPNFAPPKKAKAREIQPDLHAPAPEGSGESPKSPEPKEEFPFEKESK